MKRVWAVCLLAGCASEHATPPAPTPVQPRTCAADVTLVGATTASPTPVGPLALDDNGANICAHLDATQLTRAHFMASTDQRAGDSSGFAGALQRTDYSTIRDAGDISVGETQTQTFLSVEWGPPPGQVTDVILWVRADSTPAPATIQLDLFDPLE